MESSLQEKENSIRNPFEHLAKQSCAAKSILSIRGNGEHTKSMHALRASGSASVGASAGASVMASVMASAVNTRLWGLAKRGWPYAQSDDRGDRKKKSRLAHR